MRPVARLGVMRLGASPLDFFQPWLRVEINGTPRTDVLVSGASVTENVDGAPYTLQLTCEGTAPVAGQDIRLYLGDVDAVHRLFAGRVVRVTTAAGARHTSLIPVYAVEALGYAWSLNKWKVMGRWSGSISAILASVLSTWTVGFPGPHDIESGLPSVSDFTATNEDVTDVLDRLAVFAGARWWMDAAGVIHFTTQTGEPTTAVTDVMPGAGVTDVSHAATILNRITRVWSRGGGAAALIQVPSGATSMPMADGTWYPAAQDTQGGAGLTWTSRLESGTCRFDYGSMQSPVAATALDADHTPGLTLIYVQELSGFSAVGGWANVDGALVRYSGVSAASGSGYLSGVPSTGYGSLTTAPLYGTPCVAVPSLESLSGLTEVIPAGQTVHILYQTDNVAARLDYQSDLAAPTASYGIVDDFVSDGRWGYTEAKARGLAHLEQRSGDHQAVTFTTRDQTMRVGREVTFTLTTPAVTGTFRIASVTVSQISAGGPTSTVFPLRRVTATDQRFTLENLLKRLRRIDERA